MGRGSDETYNVWGRERACDSVSSIFRESKCIPEKAQEVQPQFVRLPSFPLNLEFTELAVKQNWPRPRTFHFVPVARQRRIHGHGGRTEKAGTPTICRRGRQTFALLRKTFTHAKNLARTQIRAGMPALPSLGHADPPIFYNLESSIEHNFTILLSPPFLSALGFNLLISVDEAEDGFWGGIFSICGTSFCWTSTKFRDVEVGADASEACRPVPRRGRGCFFVTRKKSIIFADGPIVAQLHSSHR